ncbi:TPA: hypothetical protein M4731_004643 [Salmonella enterica]|nr:hypothetical protein [Salmonella enterica]MCH5739621.1 hypothetical protein [Salmonella enterica]MCH5744715.1 hypothetical protein [Salmonella enterica]MCH5749674.1 hypothetical protein [Salmonella enterica]MCH5757166.1 hypothetical protein [Salmonella enterica]
MNSMSLSDVVDVLADVVEPLSGPCWKSQQNLVAMETGAFCILTPLFFRRLSTTREVPDDTGHTSTSRALLTEVRQADIQIDLYGENAADRAVALETFFRSPHAWKQMKARDPHVAPLYCTDAIQAPFVDAESQWEERYMLTLSLQVHISIAVPQAYFTRVNFKTTQVDS